MRNLEKPKAVLIDTAVWVDFFRGRGEIVKLVKNLVISNQAMLCGVVISEVIQGIKNEKEREIVKEAFRGIPYIKVDRACWEEAGDIALKLRKRGKVVPLTDILMATLTIHYGLQILTFDKHFELIPDVSLFKERGLRKGK
jgi:hypothetical protein